MADDFDLRNPDTFVAGTVGAPGQRIFFLQASGSGHVVSLKLEKGQVWALANLLSELLEREGFDGPAANVGSLHEPVAAAWTVGRLATGLDSDGKVIVVIAEEIDDSDSDDVVGMVHRQDLLAAMAEGEWGRTLEEMMRPVDFVAETLTADRLLRRLLETRQHLVMAINEYGGLAGLVTLEDVLEEILGTEIVGEFDTAVDMRELAHRRRQKSLSNPESPESGRP